MKIAFKCSNEVRFGDLNQGDVFKFEAVFFMKVGSQGSTTSDDKTNAIRLINGECVRLGNSTLCTPVNGAFVVDYNK